MGASAVRGMRSKRLVATLLGTVAVVLSLGAGNAFGFSCVDIGQDVVVFMTNETVTLSKGNQSAIIANGSQCGDQTASNTETIYVVAQGEQVQSGVRDDHLIIDLGGGKFEPGIDGPAEGAGRNEIEFVLVNAPIYLTILGDQTPDTINVGFGLPSQDGDGGDADVSGTTVLGDAIADEVGMINLNGDDDADIYAATPLPTPVIFPIPLAITISGRGGNDFISGKGGLGTGETTGDIAFYQGLVINGGDGDDTLQGGDGSDLISGGAGNDVIDGDNNINLQGEICVDVLSTSTGEIDLFPQVIGDTVTYGGATGPITVDLDPSEGHPGTATGEGTDVLQNIENVIGSAANDTISGDNAQNILVGGPGDDTLAGDAGNDCVAGGAGNDILDENEGTTTAQGGNGVTNGSDLLIGNAGADDTVTYSSRTTRVNVYLDRLAKGPITYCDPTFFGLGVATEDGADLDGDGLSNDDEGDCVYHDTENAIGGSGNDILDAAFVNNSTDNELTGNGGNDKLIGGSGNDLFHEGSAASGADVMDGGTGLDTCDYAARSNGLDVSLDGADNDGEAGEGDNCGGVFAPGIALGDLEAFSEIQVDTAEPVSSPQNVESVQGGSGNDTLNGSAFQNVLNGNAGNDTITGAAGQDVLAGGDGDDIVAGGLGNDAMSGGNGTDTVDYASAGAGGVGVVINLATGQASGDGNDTLTGMENASGSTFSDSIQGDAGNNVLNGRGGNDAIQGADGDDKINGGAGDDELGGGGGNDAVTGGTGSDTIRGGAGDDNLSGGPAADTLIGGDGNDVLSGGAGKDVHRGGPGTDRCNPGTPGLAAGDTAAGCES